VIIGDGHALAALMAYITLNPVRAGIITDPAEYHWSGYANRVANGMLNEHDIELVSYLHRTLLLPPQIMKLPKKKQLELLWKYFRIRLMRAKPKDKYGTRSMADKLENEGKSLELDKAQHFMLKVRFATKGIAIGSESFVEDVLSTCGRVLGYKREHHAHDYHVWDHIHTLKKHKKVLV